MTDDYRAITVMVTQIRPDSVMVEGKRIKGWQSIPRSLIHGGDELKFRRDHDLPKEMTFRILEWKADELHLA